MNKGYNYLWRALFFYLCCAIILAFCSRYTQIVSPKIADHLSVLCATILTFILVLIFLKWEKLKLAAVGIIPGRYSISRFLCGYGIGVCMAVSQALIVLAYGHFQLKPVPGISFTDIVLPLLLYFLIAGREELAFRSYSLRIINLSFGPVLALTIMSVIFIAEHIVGGMTWEMAVLGSGTGAILFGVSALKTKGLALPFGLHSAWNFGQWTLGFKNKPGIWQTVVEKGYESKVEIVGLTAFLLVMGVTIAGVCFYYGKSYLRE